MTSSLSLRQLNHWQSQGQGSPGNGVTGVATAATIAAANDLFYDVVSH